MLFVGSQNTTQGLQSPRKTALVAVRTFELKKFHPGGSEEASVLRRLDSTDHDRIYAIDRFKSLVEF